MKTFNEFEINESAMAELDSYIKKMAPEWAYGALSTMSNDIYDEIGTIPDQSILKHAAKLIVKEMPKQAKKI